MRGQFTISDPRGKEPDIILPNQLISEGIESFLKMMMRGTTTDVSVGGNFYLGICGSTIDDDETLATLPGEPTVTNGYARNAISRDATGWPTIGQVNGVWRALSKSVTFSASGGSFSETWYRCFLCNVSSGTSGLLYAVSAARDTPLLLTSGLSRVVTYELYLDS